ncbi:ABC-2 type transport system ATP-binding protein [Labedaea rhizosphaerae]|uniref:ABC-2 type transport system ATP-binding protein n=1 Tax=Labedaea rhizosphaerae TaxID=598644 RepID=A0A4R6SKW6_LABRH|nr:ABC-2 type transport system ATP-binding protein [Labedaea rhizosphaerae]
MEIDRISKRYAGTAVLTELSVRADAGQVVGILGGARSGKTTALRITAGLVDPDAGEVRIGGVPRNERTRTMLGYLPQRRGLPDGVTVLDHLVHLAELHAMATNDAHRAAEVQLAAFGLREVRSAHARDLTDGERERVLLAGALVHAPTVLVCDEPFGEHAEQTAQVLREHAERGGAVLVATGDTTAAQRFCDRVTILHNGQSVAEGAVAELRAAGATQVVVEMPDARPGWAEGIPGVEVVAAEQGRTVLRLTGNTDDQVLLRMAMAAGRVRAFRSGEPTLADLFAPVLGSGS